jgi:DNA-binding beta-propeller fold protein YncE
MRPDVPARGRGPGAVGAWPSTCRATASTPPEFGNATVSRIDATTCNALRTEGCDRPPLFAAIGPLAVDVVFDPTTRTLYADNAADATVSVIDGGWLPPGRPRTSFSCPPPSRVRSAAR